MIPGMGNLQRPNQEKLNTIIFIFDSMNKVELESNGDIFLKAPSRVLRVSKGSGTTKDQVLDILSIFKQMSSVMKKMMGSPMFSQLLSGNLNENDKKKIKTDKSNPLMKSFSNILDQMN